MISEKYRELYLSTAREQLKKLADLLLYLEKKPGNQNLIENIFRLIHSMKGASATMGYKKTVKLLHAMESVVDSVYNNEIEINNKILNTFFDGVEILKENFVSIEKNKKETKLDKDIRSFKLLFSTTKSKKIKKENIKRQKHILGSLPSVAEINVSTDKLDDLQNSIDDLLVNAMAIKSKAKSEADVDMLKLCVANDSALADLRRKVENIRIVPLKEVLSSLPFLVREISRQEDKKVSIEIKDNDLSLDKAILDEVMEILIQLIKNSISHGISEKQSKGKIKVEFSLIGDRMHIAVEDNGRGINFKEISELAVRNKIISQTQLKKMSPQEKKDLIFAPGISKGKVLSTTSGRGVGLSLVKNTVAELNGDIEIISTPKKGTKFIIDLPRPLSVFRSIVFEVLDYVFGLPLINIEHLVELEEPDSFSNQKYFNYKKKKYKLLSVLDLIDLGKFKPMYKYVAILKNDKEKLAVPLIIRVEEHELVMKDKPLVLNNIKYIKGVAISSQGQAVLVLDVNNLS